MALQKLSLRYIIFTSCKNQHVKKINVLILNRCMLLIMNDDRSTQVLLHVYNKVIFNCAPKGGPEDLGRNPVLLGSVVF